MKKLFYGFFSFLFLMVLSFSAQAKTMVKNVDLTVGIFRDIKVPKAPVNISTDGTFKKCGKVRYNDRGKVLRIHPKKEGFCTLIIKSAATDKPIYSFTLDVKKTDLKKVAREIKSLIKDIDGVKIRIANNTVIVDGQVLLPKEVGRIHTVVRQYPDHARSLVTLSPIAQQKLLSLLKEPLEILKFKPKP